MPYKFSKKERLKLKKDIDILFSKGKTTFSYPFKVFFILNDSPQTILPKILISVPKKKIRKAYKRNKIKRRVREAYRLQKTILANPEGFFALKSIGFIYVASEEIDYQFLAKKMKYILEVLAEK